MKVVAVSDHILFWISRASGILATKLASLFGNGSVIGGTIALRIFPSFLRFARKGMSFPIVFVMGSNGKTTTSKYLVELAETLGEKTLNNSAGSNMKTGIAALVIRNWREIVRGQFSLGIFEIDEAYAETLGRDLMPEHAVLLNVQIDQIYRLYEPERVAEMFESVLPFIKTSVVVNGNDALLMEMVTRLPRELSVRYFGLNTKRVMELGLYKAVNIIRDPLHVLVSERQNGYDVEYNLEKVALKVPTAGVHFALNGAAAIAVGFQAFSSPHSLQELASSLATAGPAFGRGEILHVGNVRFELILFKNRSSLQLNINSISEPANSTVIAFDEYSQDPSWLFAIDYSKLGKVDWVSGEKADFLELTLKYLGVSVGGREESITSVIKKIVGEYSGFPQVSLHRLFLDYDQMIAARGYFGLQMGQLT